MLRIAILAAFIAITAAPREAHAATAFLESCNAGTSVTGAFIYIGTYNYFGKRFTMAFSEYCPATVEIQ